MPLCRPRPTRQTRPIRPRRASRRIVIVGATAPSPMATRVAAASFLAVSALVAWLTITTPLAARLLQVGIVLSITYVGWLAWHGARVIREVLATGRTDDATGRADG